MIVHDLCPACSDTNISPVLSAKDYTVSDEIFEIWECSKCTLRFTQNAPSEAESGKYYQSEKYISHSDTGEGFINKIYHRVRKRTLKQKKNLLLKTTGIPTGNLLDVGSGTGAFLHTMKNAGWQATGLEPDETARKKAFELYGLPLMDAKEFYNLSTGKFDAITLWHVLEHVHDLHGYMNQLKNLLSSNGKLFIAVPNYTSYDAQYYKTHWAAYDVPRHLYHFSPEAMKNLFSLHGLQLLAQKPMWYDSVYVSMLSEQYKTGKPHTAKALMTGAISNLKSFSQIEKCSSVIYVGEAV